MKLRAETFQPAQIGRLNDALPTTVVAWAAESSLVRVDGSGQPLRDLASMYAVYRAQLARSRLSDFRAAVIRSGTMSGPRQELGGLTPREVGGRAAGQIAIAKTVVTWYGLEAADIARFAAAEDEVFAGMMLDGLEEAVCDAPQQLGIAAITPRDVYLETVPLAVTAVSVHGSGALQPYVDFPVYPALMDLAA